MLSKGSENRDVPQQLKQWHVGAFSILDLMVFDGLLPRPFLYETASEMDIYYRQSECPAKNSALHGNTDFSCNTLGDLDKSS